MKTTIIALIIGAIVFGQAWIIKFQAENNNQLMFELNATQTAFLIQSDQIAAGLCLPKLEMK